MTPRRVARLVRVATFDPAHAIVRGRRCKVFGDGAPQAEYSVAVQRLRGDSGYKHAGKTALRKTRQGAVEPSASPSNDFNRQGRGVLNTCCHGRVHIWGGALLTLLACTQFSVEADNSSRRANSPAPASSESVRWTLADVMATWSRTAVALDAREPADSVRALYAAYASSYETLLGVLASPNQQLCRVLGTVDARDLQERVRPALEALVDSLRARVGQAEVRHGRADYNGRAMDGTAGARAIVEEFIGRKRTPVLRAVRPDEITCGAQGG